MGVVVVLTVAICGGGVGCVDLILLSLLLLMLVLGHVHLLTLLFDLIHPDLDFVCNLIPSTALLKRENSVNPMVGTSVLVTC